MSGPSSSSSLTVGGGAAGEGGEGVVDDSPINAHDPNRWFFEKARVENSPSRKAGVDADKELAYRQQAANFIQDIGQRLQVNQLCINTAIVYMHRFYMYHSFTHFHRNAVSTASIFLAAKVEEQPRKLDHVIKVSHYCLHRDLPAIDPNSEAYREQSAELVMNENILLQTLGFDVAIDHPHTHVVKCCQLVRASKDLAQTSYFMATNSLHLTTMCLQYRPTLVACVCIHLACKWSSWEIPRSKEGKDWWKYVDENCTAEQLEAMTSEFLLIFNKSPSRLKRKIISLNASGGPEGGKLLNVPALAGLTLPEGGAPHAQPRSHSRSPSPKRQRVGGKPGEMVLKGGMKPPGHAAQGGQKGPPPPQHGSMKPPPVKGPPPPPHGVPSKEQQHRQQQPPPYGRPGSGPQGMKGPPPSYPGKPPSSKPPPPHAGGGAGNARAYAGGMMVAPQVAAPGVPPNKVPSDPNRLAPPKDPFKYQTQGGGAVQGSGRSGGGMGAPNRPHSAPNNAIPTPKPQDNRGGVNHTKTDASKYGGGVKPPPPSHPLAPPSKSGGPPPPFYKQPSLLPPPPGGRPHPLQMPPDMKKATGAAPPPAPQQRPPPSSHTPGQGQGVPPHPPPPHQVLGAMAPPLPPLKGSSTSGGSELSLPSNGEAGSGVRASLFSPEASSLVEEQPPQVPPLSRGSGDSVAKSFLADLGAAEEGRKAKKEKKKHKHKEKGREEKKHHKKEKHKKKKRDDDSPPHENLKIKLTLNKEGYHHQVTAAPSSSKQKQRPS